MQEVKNKQGEILGTYKLTEVTKADTYAVPFTNRNGDELTIEKTVTKEDILKLASQQFNTNVRNYVAGLAREKKGSKLSALEDYFNQKGISIKGVSVEELKAKLEKLV